MEMTLTAEQYNSLANVILENYQDTLPVLNKAINNWWKEFLGFQPSRIDRLHGQTFKITK